jgi:hypothetical protein
VNGAGGMLTGTGAAQVLPETARRGDDRQTFRNRDANQHEPTVPGDDLTGRRPAKTYLMPPTDDTAPRVFIGYKEASGRPATLDEGWRFAFENLALVDGLEA